MQASGAPLRRDQLPAEIGGSLPPLLRGPHQGEVQLHIPAFGARGGVGAARHRHVTVEAEWWGMDEDAEAPVPRLVATKLRERAVAGLQNTHKSALNTAWFPIVVKAEAMQRYLDSMVRPTAWVSCDDSSTPKGAS